MPYKDPEKRRECRRKWYSNNKESEKAHVSRRKKQIKKWFSEYKSNLKCNRCKESHQATLDFHHKGEKEKGINFMTHWGYSINRIKKEISMCEVLCANCHRKLHHNIRNKNKNL
tara:strand:+ start:536 stop:877 length:342 start_codon:yes stop_codon:yes gene_type:complete